MTSHASYIFPPGKNYWTTYLGVDPTDVQKEVVDTRGDHARFKLLEYFYKDHLQMVMDVESDDMQVDYHW